MPQSPAVSRVLSGTTFVLSCLLGPAALGAQAPGVPFTSPQGDLAVVGWRGFLDLPFILTSLGSLLLAAALGAIIAYHPMTMRSVDTPEEAEAPNSCIMYGVVGAVIGVTVLRYGMVVGVVVFGIGGLMRFRTDMGSTRGTGRLLIVTLVGLSSGLGLPHFAVITTVFVFALIYLLDARPVRRLIIKELPAGRVAEAADAYRAVLHREGCMILSERKAFAKQHVSFVFRAPRKGTQQGLQAACAQGVPRDVLGEVDWEVD